MSSDTDDNRERQQEELYAMSAIYGDDCCPTPDQHLWEVWVPSRDAERKLRLRVHLPDSYPGLAAPIPELQDAHLSPDVTAWACRELEALFTPGEEVLYNWVEWLRDNQELWQLPPASKQDDGFEAQHAQHAQGDPGEEGQEDSEGYELSDEEAGGGFEGAAGTTGRGPGMATRWQRAGGQGTEGGASCPDIIHGEPFTERKSTFQAHVAPVLGMEQVEAVMSRLLESNKIQRASHNIMAYRIHNATKDTFLQDYDDDGETAAGGRLLHLLQVVGACNVVVVVSRWYGGIHLGPARFTHINNAARTLLASTGYIKADPQPRKKK